MIKIASLLDSKLKSDLNYCDRQTLNSLLSAGNVLTSGRLALLKKAHSAICIISCITICEPDPIPIVLKAMKIFEENEVKWKESVTHNEKETY